MPLDLERHKMLRDYAWDYFALHADQRIKTFNFFVVFATLLAGAIVGLIKDKGDIRWISLLGFLLFFLSIIFWALDRRNRGLVRNGEEAIKFLDAELDLPDFRGAPHVLQIFAHDDHFTDEGFHITYSKCLGFVFFIFAVLGIALGVASLWLHHS